jgi:hypothetical protein
MSRRFSDPVTIASHRLSDDRLVEIFRYGRKYCFIIHSNEWLQPGDSTDNLTLDAARRMLADAIKADVLETE